MHKTDSSNETESGLLCWVYRSSGKNCSNGGISSRVDEVVILGLGKDAEVFKPSAKRPAVRIVKREFCNRIYLHAEPVDQPEGLVGPCAGGTFIYSCDSRFPSDYPIALHDRWDTYEDYLALSR